jgi:hypothetical protein
VVAASPHRLRHQQRQQAKPTAARQGIEPSRAADEKLNRWRSPNLLAPSYARCSPSVREPNKPRQDGHRTPIARDRITGNS